MSERSSGLDLIMFFRDQGIDVFSEISLDKLSDEDRSLTLDFFPAAHSVIVFGKEVPVPVYRMSPREKTKGMLRIAEALDNTAVRLAARFEQGQVPARTVPLYLPVKIADGKIQGVVRLKQVAAAGGLGSPGMNSVLLNSRFGPRLLLSGVVTGRHVRESQPDKHDAEKKESLACSGCGHCIRVCPHGALGPDGIDAFRCQTVSAWVPPLLVPTVKWVLGRTLLLKCMRPLAPWIARTATIRCSLCITQCPSFSGAEGRDTTPLHDTM